MNQRYSSSTSSSTSANRYAAYLAASFTLVCCWLGSAQADEACFSDGIDIPDVNVVGITQSISIPESAQIQRLRLSLNITHSYVGDLEVSLKHVDTGTTAVLIDRMGDTPGNQFGCNSDDLNVVLDDFGTGGPIENICGENAPLAKTPRFPPAVTPNNPLAVFNGENINGTWELIVRDLASPDPGRLNNFCIGWNSTDIEARIESSKSFVAVGTLFTQKFEIINNGPYPRDPLTVSAVLSGEALVSNIVASLGLLNYFPSGVINSVIDQLPLLAVGSKETINVEYFVPKLRPSLSGPIPDSTVLVVNSPASAPREIPTYPLNFDSSLHPSPVTADVVLANDGIATAPGGLVTDACEPLNPAQVAGKTVIADSTLFFPSAGNLLPIPCDYETQTANAIAAGAVGLILQNVSDNAAPLFSFPTPPPTGKSIPVVHVGRAMGVLLRSGANVTISVGQAGVWEFTAQLIAQSGDDDPNPYNSQPLATVIIGKDKDLDGTPDTVDSCESDSSKTVPGVCGCGLSDADVDGDGLAECQDLCPNDGAKSSPGSCGCGIADSDANGNGVLDCQLNNELKARLEALRTLVSSLKIPSNEKQTKTMKLRKRQIQSLLTELLSFGDANQAGISVTASDLSLTKTLREINSGARTTVQFKSKTFKQSKAATLKKIAKLTAAV